MIYLDIACMSSSSPLKSLLALCCDAVPHSMLHSDCRIIRNKAIHFNFECDELRWVASEINQHVGTATQR